VCILTEASSFVSGLAFLHVFLHFSSLLRAWLSVLVQLIACCESSRMLNTAHSLKSKLKTILFLAAYGGDNWRGPEPPALLIRFRPERSTNIMCMYVKGELILLYSWYYL